VKTKELLKSNYQQVLLVFVAFLAMVLVSNFYVSSIVRQQVKDIGDATMDATQAAVSAGLTESELWFGNVVQAVETMINADRSNAEILQFLYSTQDYFNAERSPLRDFMKVYGYIRDEWLDGTRWVPPSGYVPEKRPWHIGAVAGHGRIFFSEPYVDAQTGGMCISFSQELLDQNKTSRGVLAVDLKLATITDHIRRQNIAGNGYGVLIDDTMRFIVHRNAEMVGKTMAGAGGGYGMLAESLEREEQISAARFDDVDGKDSVVFFRKIFNGWHIGIIIPRTSYYHEVYALAAVLVVMGFLLATALSTLLVRTRVQKMRSDEENLSKSSFLARMSHEMRTPMNAIIGMATIARESDDPEKKEYCLGKISDASNHLLGVINDVLDMSKIEAGKLELSETDFTVDSLLRQVETVATYKMDEKHQHFRVDVASDVPAALIADRQRLAQVITNLLSNANKFTPEGGHISLSVRRLSDEGELCVLEFEVRDDGIGISLEQQSRLFRSFEQADGSISRKFGGTGLGLAISKRIIEMMHGKAWIESALGKGARFLFTIRVHEGQARESGETDGSFRSLAEQGPIFAGKSILLAEDVDINREIVLTLLEDTGVVIDCAVNGREACRKFAANPNAYDLIFLDIHMPEMDGYDAAKTIRRMKYGRAKTIPIVAMTANVFKEDIEKCLAAGMDDHVGKPLELGELLEKMKIYLYPERKSGR